MTAGRGIVHSERGPDELKASAYVNHGIQLWAALPQAFEEVAPDFVHTPSASIPEVKVGDAQVRVLIGQAFGKTSPVKTFAPTVYLDVKLASGGVLELPPLAAELAVYSIDSPVDIDGVLLPAHTLALLAPSVAVRITATAAARLMVLGGDALDGHRLMWWNFVSSRKERLVQASSDWAAQTMGHVADDAEFIPLPEKRI
jgi:redox-sensitive bicupin YhaK (pirin superfamily)